MIITRLKLKNWKNFVQADVKLRERVFIVGSNASGKSNFLDVFRFLRDVARPRGGGLQQAVSVRGGVSKIRSLSARNNPLIEIAVTLADSADAKPRYVYELGIRQESKSKRRVMVKYERVYKGATEILSRPNSVDDRDEEQLTLTYLENPTTNSNFREIAELLGSASYLHLVPQLLRSVDSTDIGESGEDYYGKNFLVRISQTPERIRKARLKKIDEALSKTVPQFEELKNDRDHAGVPHLMMRLKHWRPKAGWQDESQFSDGTIRMLGLFWSMLEGDSILLFEEPELSLNDSIVKQLPALLYKLQSSKGRQVILSTHSHALLSDTGIAAEETLLLETNTEGTTITEGGSVTGAAAMMSNGMSVGDVLLPRTAPASVSELAL